jgi:hypothetical protein
MLTDDDLTRELGAAFRSATEDLTYEGRTRPPRLMSTALPALGVAAVLAGGAVVGVNAADHHQPVARPSAVTPTALGPSGIGPTTLRSSAGKKPRFVTRTMTLAGFTLRVKTLAGAPDPVIAKVDFGGLPAGVQPVTLTGSTAQAWTGTDPTNGDNALYMKVAIEGGTRLFALESATWTDQQLIDLVESPQPSAVPGVSGSSSAS